MIYAILEDEIRIQDFLQRSVVAQVSTTQCFSKISYFKTWMQIDQHEADVVILDRMLPDGDGATVIPLVKKRWPRAVVLVLSSIYLQKKPNTSI